MAALEMWLWPHIVSLQILPWLSPYRNLSVMKAARHAKAATTGRLFLYKPRITATMKPTVALMTLAVEVKMAGIVITVRQVYGT